MPASTLTLENLIRPATLSLRHRCSVSPTPPMKSLGVPQWPRARSEIPVAVVVAEGRGEGVLRPHEVQPGTRGHVAEGAVAVVGKDERRIAVEPRNEYVEVAIPVEVCHGGRTVTVSPVSGLRVCQPGLRRDIRELEVAVVPIQQVGTQVSAHDEEVDVPVPVVVAGGDTAGCHDRNFRVAHAAGETDGE